MIAPPNMTAAEMAALTDDERNLHEFAQGPIRHPEITGPQPLANALLCLLQTVARTRMALSDATRWMEDLGDMYHDVALIDRCHAALAGTPAPVATPDPVQAAYEDAARIVRDDSFLTGEAIADAIEAAAARTKGGGE